MDVNEKFEVIIIGGSYSGLAAAMSLGRALRKVLVIDSGLPCNRQTPHSHNFITHDGHTPGEIANAAREQVAAYSTVKFYSDLAISAIQTTSGFEVHTKSGGVFSSRKLIMAAGIKDIMPDIKGFAECWGISVIHCPYCHGYEVRNEPTGIIANGDLAFHFAPMISHWTKNLTVFTDGKSTLTEEQTAKIKAHNISIIEKRIISFEHINGQLKNIVLDDQSSIPLKAVYAKPKQVQHSDIPQTLGCELDEQGLIVVDNFHRTNIKGVYACGDSAQFFRSVSVAVGSGSAAGAITNNDMISEDFQK